MKVCILQLHIYTNNCAEFCAIKYMYVFFYFSLNNGISSCNNTQEMSNASVPFCVITN